MNRGKLTGQAVEELEDRPLKDETISGLYKGKTPGDHMRNFFECVEDRELPISDVYTHHHTMVSCHMCNIALMLGRELQWDSKQEDFVGDEQASALKSRRSRELPSISV